MPYSAEFSLFNQKGQRKYLNHKERARFYECTKTLPLDKQLFCQLIYFTGARISEIADLKVVQLDFIDKSVVLNSLKQRKKYVYRSIPLPDHLLGGLLAYIDHRRKIFPNDPRQDDLWWFTTRTGFNYVKDTMKKAYIRGPRACPKGLRHGFAVHAVTKVPITQVQVWMGHAELETTGVYLKVSGQEEREWAEMLWDEENS